MSDLLVSPSQCRLELEHCVPPSSPSVLLGCQAARLLAQPYADGGRRDIDWFGPSQTPCCCAATLTDTPARIATCCPGLDVLWLLWPPSAGEIRQEVMERERRDDDATW